MDTNVKKSVIPEEFITSKIHVIRAKMVMLDEQIADSVTWEYED